MKEKIIELIEDFGPIKDIELDVRFTNRYNLIPDTKYYRSIGELIENGDIIRLLYTSPKMDSREKLYIFQKELKF